MEWKIRLPSIFGMESGYEKLIILADRTSWESRGLILLWPAGFCVCVDNKAFRCLQNFLLVLWGRKVTPIGAQDILPGSTLRGHSW